ncbi:hypothetical protein L596_005448 [Steinernema carpocapsae]|uniref:Peptidase S26 domain-containing protein n=1 Tax=Steinernema carpocapsae TaxID=34508 RepID=A0A4U8V2N7_STECR|nr:hypothetical protein L596_005448 [Steinernema carpocapsae]
MSYLLRLLRASTVFLRHPIRNTRETIEESGQRVFEDFEKNVLTDVVTAKRGNPIATIATSSLLALVSAYVFSWTFEPKYQLCPTWGPSMQPTFAWFNLVLIKRIDHPREELKVGDVAVFAFTTEEGQFIVKRIRQIRKEGYFVLGDNSENSLDSRSFGIIADNYVRSKVICSLIPPNFHVSAIKPWWKLW